MQWNYSCTWHSVQTSDSGPACLRVPSRSRSSLLRRRGSRSHFAVRPFAMACSLFASLRTGIANALLPSLQGLRAHPLRLHNSFRHFAPLPCSQLTAFGDWRRWRPQHRHPPRLGFCFVVFSVCTCLSGGLGLVPCSADSIFIAI